MLFFTIFLCLFARKYQEAFCSYIEARILHEKMKYSWGMMNELILGNELDSRISRLHNQKKFILSICVLEIHKTIC